MLSLVLATLCMAKSTKDKILDAAVRCFNRDGLVNVRLQHIGDEAEYMSVDNLAYHFRTKEHIVQAIWELWAVGS